MNVYTSVSYSFAFTYKSCVHLKTTLTIYIYIYICVYVYVTWCIYIYIHLNTACIHTCFCTWFVRSGMTQVALEIRRVCYMSYSLSLTWSVGCWEWHRAGGPQGQVCSTRGLARQTHVDWAYSTSLASRTRTA